MLVVAVEVGYSQVQDSQLGLLEVKQVAVAVAMAVDSVELAEKVVVMEVTFMQLAVEVAMVRLVVELAPHLTEPVELEVKRLT
jgi:hypothetical protein